MRSGRHPMPRSPSPWPARSSSRSVLTTPGPRGALLGADHGTVRHRCPAARPCDRSSQGRTSPDDHRHSRRSRHCGVLDDRQHRLAVAVSAAFTILVLQKTYSVAKSAVVPALVRSEHDLVGANSRLALISAVSGMVGATVSGVLSLIGGPAFAAAVAMVGFVVTTVVATKIRERLWPQSPPRRSRRRSCATPTFCWPPMRRRSFEGSSGSSPSSWPSSSAAARKGSTSAPSVRRRGSHRHRPWDRYLWRSRGAGVALRCRAPPRWHRCADRGPSRPESARAGGRGTHAADGAGDRGCRCAVRSVLQRSVRRCRAVVRDRERSRHRETRLRLARAAAAPTPTTGVRSPGSKPASRGRGSSVRSFPLSSRSISSWAASGSPQRRSSRWFPI